MDVYMRNNKFEHVKNGIWMVRKNIKTYAFLSVTIIISFTTLLCFLIYSDSSIFNQFKEDLQASPYISIVTSGVEDEKEEKVFRILSEKLDELEDTYYYTYVEQGVSLEHITGSQLLTGMMRVVPAYCWGYYYSATKRFSQRKEEKRISLSKGQAVISEELYDLLKEARSKEDKLYINIPVQYSDNTIQFHTFEVIGVCNSDLSPAIIQDEDGKLSGCVDIFVSADNFMGKDIDVLNKEMLVYSKDMESVSGWLEQLDLSNATSYEAKKIADEEMRESIFVKSVIAIALLFLLGINLYSSFNNALNERKFEIGVRRAIGASPIDIILQFFVEGLTVMIVNMMLSIMCSTIIMCLYRIFRLFIYHEEWIISITGYSVAIFVCCCIFLSLVYSIVFAVMSLNVEIVYYLKNE